jgi:hypothetical protein
VMTAREREQRRTRRSPFEESARYVPRRHSAERSPNPRANIPARASTSGAVLLEADDWLEPAARFRSCDIPARRPRLRHERLLVVWHDPSYPFTPKWNRYLLPGQFWAVPLSDGRFGCGRVMGSLPGRVAA